MSQTFASLELCTSLLQAVERLGFTTPTPVQSQVIPAAMRGVDLLVSSQTGSGKTAAFLLPVLQGLLAEAQAGNVPSGRNAPLAVVLCPTRELAQQVAADAIDLVRGGRGVRVATVMGGMPYGKQIAALKGAALVVATPGRLLDLNNTRAIRLDQVRCLVIDEADRMLDLGFADDLRAIDERSKQRSQTLMFSATFEGRMMEIAGAITRDAERIELGSGRDRHENIAQTLHWADNPEHKRRLLDHWLTDVSLEQAVVFASTQVESEQIADELRARGFRASALHGAMPQALRNRRLDSLRNGQIRILVATDVAARGIDVPTISHVINFGLPMKAEDYVHRIGRTGRAGRNGQAVTLAEHRDRGRVRDIERFTRHPLEVSVIAGLEPTRVERPRGAANERRPGGGAHRQGQRPGARPSSPRSGAPAAGHHAPRNGAPRARPSGPSRDGGGERRGQRREA